MLDTKPHYKVPEIAREWDVTPAHLYQLIRSGRVLAIRIGGAVRIPHSERERLEGLRESHHEP